MVPPEGVVADLQNPTDVLRTTNFITQALTLAFCSAFVFVRGLQKVRVFAFSWSVDDCEPPSFRDCSAEPFVLRVQANWLNRPYDSVVDVPGRVLHGWSVKCVVTERTAAHVY